MAASLLKILFLTISLICLATGENSDHVDSELLNVPTWKFSGSVRTTIGTVREVISTLSRFSSSDAVDDLRLSNAIYCCLDLMGLSVNQLNWTLSASARSPNGKGNSTRNVSADLKASTMCGAVTNPTTCREGFEDMNSPVTSLISDSLDLITSSGSDLLSMIRTTSNGGRDSEVDGGSGSSQFPGWLKPGDRKLLRAAKVPKADAVVDINGSTKFRSIMDAVRAAPAQSNKRYVIYIKKGKYQEYVEIGNEKWNIMMIGDGMDATVISGKRSHGDGLVTYRTATFGVKGRGFIARDMTFENTAGPEKHQAVAYLSDSDSSVLYRCAIRGYQDSLYPHCMRQFYRDCTITGTVDIIAGFGTVVFQNCLIQTRKGLAGQQNTIAAHGREHPAETTGFSFLSCNISAEPGAGSIPTYLGRPWKPYSRTVFMQSYIGGAVKPEGWLQYNGTVGLGTLYYGEYKNYGPGAGVMGRVKWPGYHVINDLATANNFTVAKFIDGNKWLPSTRIPFRAGLA